VDTRGESRFGVSRGESRFGVVTRGEARVLRGALASDQMLWFTMVALAFRLVDAQVARGVTTV